MSTTDDPLNSEDNTYVTRLAKQAKDALAGFIAEGHTGQRRKDAADSLEAFYTSSWTLLHALDHKTGITSPPPAAALETPPKKHHDHPGPPGK